MKNAESGGNALPGIRQLEFVLPLRTSLPDEPDAAAFPFTGLHDPIEVFLKKLPGFY